MKVFKELSEIFRGLNKSFTPIITIGNFDGLHQGHQSLFDKAKEIAQQEGKPWGGLTFSPHPRTFFTGDHSPGLFSIEQKIEAFERSGATFLCIQPFNKDFSQILPRDFFKTLATAEGGVSSINLLRSGYYMIKVTIAILIDRLRGGHQ